MRDLEHPGATARSRKEPHDYKSWGSFAADGPETAFLRCRNGREETPARFLFCDVLTKPYEDHGGLRPGSLPLGGQGGMAGAIYQSAAADIPDGRRAR